jgi:hypothetical protein
LQGAISAAGAVTAAGASLTECVITKNEFKKIQEKINHDTYLHNELIRTVDDLAQSDRHLIRYGNRRIEFDDFFDDYSFSLMSLISALAIGRSLESSPEIPVIRPLRSTAAVVSTGTAGAQVLVRGGGRALMSGMSSVGRVFFVAGFVLSVVTVPLDIYCLAKDSKEVHLKTPSDASDKIQTTIFELENSLAKLRDEEIGDWQML